MSGSSSSSGTTTPVINTLPGATGDTGYGTSTSIFNQALGLTNQGANTSPIGNFNSYGSVTPVKDFSSYGDVNTATTFKDPLTDALLHPKFGARNDAEQELINGIMDITAGRGAVSGLGAPTQTALATSIAPTLVDLNDRNIKNLLEAWGTDVTSRGQDITRNLGIRGQDVTQYGTETERNLGLRGQDININSQQIQSWMAALQSLAELAGLAMPQTVVGSEGTQTGKANNIFQDIPSAFGINTGKLW